ncbi:TlpA disulfide reductase family protein [Flavivirga amylovorans]|uniref:TlpA disulfide reductase family protein n=1 Tax=Flavivirga amylovorans TaxID=870486 RepID=A0ABT8X108_9FLAO|nr:TlpA disulfide reductase family protein [Flavivirga amylovorans]MDO5987634.1 TlpA disulfide reductase family protein [Flavivirga amylovorans]
MKKLLYIVSIALLLGACKQEAPKDYVTLSGIIKNPNSDSLIVAQRSILKTIKVNTDGSFSDTLKVETGSYILFDGKERTSVYLKNGYDLNLSVDAKEFDETITYNGIGSEANNYLAKKALLEEGLINYEALMTSDKSSFDKQLNAAKNEFKLLLDATKGLDSAFIASEEKESEMMTKQLASMFDGKQAILAMKGKESPKFTDYENYAGGLTSLDDLKGKYVYIDMWATWCGPCKKEIPFLKEVEKAYHGKPIEFVSISIDRQNAYDTWRSMVKEKELSGIQLFAKEDKTFADAYKITGIPRFILIDPQGNVIDADAPRPSDEELKSLFNELNI